MTARQILVGGAMPSRDANGRALPANLYFYDPDTALSTPATVYTTSALDVAHAFPVASDAAGRFEQIWADDAESFDVVWANAATGAQIRVLEGITPLSDALEASATLAESAADAAELAQAFAEAAADRAEGAANGIDTNATSITALTATAGSKAITLAQTGRTYAQGMEVCIAELGNATNRMFGTVTAFADPLLTVLVTSPGTGSASAWTISQSPAGGVLSIGGVGGVLTAAQTRTAIGFDAAVDTRAIAFAVVL